MQNKDPFDSSHWASVTNISLSFVPELFQNPYLLIDQKEHENKVNRLRLEKKLVSDTQFLHSRKRTSSKFEEYDKLKQKVSRIEKSVIEAQNKKFELLHQLKKTEEELQKEHELAKMHEERSLQLQRERNGEKVIYPSTWEPQTENCELKKLAVESEEYLRVEKRFKETMEDANIEKIERVQNKWLWEQYYHERWKLEEKNRGKVNELEYFHGTSETDPELIYNGEDGFDMRFSSAGYWGKGIYFAKKASYSDGYSHGVEHEDDEHKQMFFVKVLAGDSVHLPRDDDLLSPPIKPHSNSELNFTSERYDSVTGFTGDTDVCIVYTNGRGTVIYKISNFKPIQCIRLLITSKSEELGDCFECKYMHQKVVWLSNLGQTQLVWVEMPQN